VSLAILFHFVRAQHVSDINMSIIKSSRLFCWITTLVVLFVVRCLLEFRCGWVGVVSMLQAVAQELCFSLQHGYHSNPTTPKLQHTSSQEQYDQCGNSTEQSRAPDDGYINLLTPSDDYSGCTTPLSSKCCILYIYSTNIGTENFKHDIYSPFFPLQKCSLFHKSNIFGSCIIHILYRGCAKI